LTDQMNLSKTWLWGSFRYVQIMVPHAWYCTVTFLCRCCLQMPYAVKSKLLFQYVYTIYGDFSILITLQFLFLLNTNVMKRNKTMYTISYQVWRNTFSFNSWKHDK
jgi:hypothetical protein